MIKDENVIAIIPARSGSKGLKNKNIIDYKGIPLFLHSYNYALKSLNESRIIISTDSLAYKKIAIDYGVNENSIILRPKSISEDLVVDYPVALHSWLIYEENNNETIEFLVWLRPTSPIRQEGLIEKAMTLIQSDNKITSVRAMRKVSEHPYRIWEKTDNNSVFPIIDNNNQNELANIPRQLLPQNYLFQSGEIEVVKRSTMQKGSFSGEKVCPLIINEHNPDIDNYNDLKKLHDSSKNENWKY